MLGERSHIVESASRIEDSDADRKGGFVDRRTALRAIAVAAASWPALLGAQSGTRRKLPTIHVYEGPD